MNTRAMESTSGLKLFEFSIGNVTQSRSDLVPAFHAERDQLLIDHSAQHQHGRAKTVVVFDEAGERILDQFLGLSFDDFLAARQGGGEKLARPSALFGGLPYGVAFDVLDGSHACFAAF